ncbi:MAG: hypothetical protein ABI720_08655 [Actinomycetes bacterium]
MGETLLRGIVFLLPLLMPFSLRTPCTGPALAVYSGGLTAYVAAWAAVVWAPTSAWSTSAVGFTALAWTSMLLFTGVGLRSTLRFFPRYRPWMYLCAASPLYCCSHGPNGNDLGLVLLILVGPVRVVAGVINSAFPVLDRASGTQRRQARAPIPCSGQQGLHGE